LIIFLKMVKFFRPLNNYVELVEACKGHTKIEILRDYPDEEIQGYANRLFEEYFQVDDSGYN